MKSASKKALKDDEDIESVSDGDHMFFDASKNKQAQNGAITAELANDAFFENETPEEKRLRMTKALL